MSYRNSTLAKENGSKDSNTMRMPIKIHAQPSNLNLRQMYSTTFDVIVLALSLGRQTFLKDLNPDFQLAAELIFIRIMKY